MTIKNLIQIGSKNPTSSKILTLVAVILFLQAIIGYFIIYFTYIERTKSYLGNITSRVQEDIEYQNGTWDMSKYYADPQVPGRSRLYIFASDGFVIDRWKPITHFLDFSNFEYLLSYHKPTTIKTRTSQSWRILSKKITGTQDTTIGVVTVASFNPTNNEYEKLDGRLASLADQILSKIKIDKEEIDTSGVDSRNIDFDVSFQVVDRFNKILAKNNNINAISSIPSFIDASYIRQEMQSPTIKQVEDGNDTFLVKSKVLLDKNLSQIGIVVAATNISIIYDTLIAYVVAASLISLILLLAASFTIPRFIANYKPNYPLLSTNDIKNVTFSKKDSNIKINDQVIPLTYATNQYYLCQALFSTPTKKWENDELLEKFGEQNSKLGWRKVYDAMAAINTKVNQLMKPKLFINNNKTYQINPQITGKIT